MRSLLTHRGKIAVVTAQYSYKVRRILLTPIALSILVIVLFAAAIWIAS